MVNEDTGGLGWNYFEFSFNGDHDNFSGSYGVTWLCPEPAVGVCYDFDAPSNIRWASIWLNSTTLDTVSGYQFDSTATHELGHTMGLGHHADDGRLSVMALNGTSSRTDTPQGDDIGNTDWCSFPPPGGLRCIFRSNGGL